MKRLLRKGFRLTFNPGGKMFDPRLQTRTDGLKDIAKHDNKTLVKKLREIFKQED